MTSGSVMTHLIVTSRALVDVREERVALAGVARQSAVPLEYRDSLVDRLVDRRHGSRVYHGGGRAPQALAQRDHVVHLDLALAVADRDKVRELGHHARLGAGHGDH